MSSLSFCHALIRRACTAVLLLAVVVVLAHDPRPAVDLRAFSSDVLWNEAWTTGAFVDAGATPAEALAASTSIAARACGLGDRKGMLRKGYDADILIVVGDLRAGLGALADVRAVLKGGWEVAR